MRLSGVSSSGRGFHFVVDVSNNGRSPVEASLRTQLPLGWRRAPAAENWRVGARSRRSIGFHAIPSRETKPGRYEIRAELTSPSLPAPLEFSEAAFFLPESLNFLNNPGFEEADAASWGANEGTCEVDASQHHSGKQSLNLHNSSPSEQSGVSQTILLNQKAPRPIIVRGHAKAENVSGHPDRTFSIYVDIYYTDGTALYGQTINWQTGTTDWQCGEMKIEPAKPIRNVNVYLLLRGHTGAAWFDDIFVAEDPAP